MRKMHEKEARDMHGHHRDAMRDMHKRHEQAMSEMMQRQMGGGAAAPEGPDGAGE